MIRATTYNQKTLLSLVIFFSVIALLAIPYQKWGFKTDDFGNIFHAKVSSWSDIAKFFYEGNIECVSHASNAPPQEQAFFCGLLRPLSFVYYAPQYFFFKDNPYGYFFVTILFHAANSVLLFYFLLQMTSVLWAFLGACFFAFHPSLWNWLGWISAQTYFIELFILFLLIMLLATFIRTHNYWYYALSVLLFMSNLLLKESTIIFPVWVVLALYLYQKFLMPSAKRIDLLCSSLKIASGYWLASVAYVGYRLSLFPLTSNTSTLTFQPTLASFIARQKSRMFDFVTYVTDMLGLSWLEGNNRMGKGLLLLSIVLLCVFLFRRSSKKPLLFFLLLSIVLFSWPALLMHYQPRYIYMSLVFFIMFVVGSFQYISEDFHIGAHPEESAVASGVGGRLEGFERTKMIASYAGITCICVLLLHNIFFLKERLKQREAILHQVTQSFRTLLAQNNFHGRPLCFIGLPRQWFAMGTAQAIWLLSHDASYPVYQYGPQVNLKDKNYYLVVPAFEKEYVHIERTHHGFLFSSHDTKKIWFGDGDEKLAVSDLLIDKKHRVQNPVFITWDYKNAQFLVIGD